MLRWKNNFPMFRLPTDIILISLKVRRLSGMVKVHIPAAVKTFALRESSNQALVNRKGTGRLDAAGPKHPTSQGIFFHSCCLLLQKTLPSSFQTNSFRRANIKSKRFRKGLWVYLNFKFQVKVLHSGSLKQGVFHEYKNTALRDRGLVRIKVEGCYLLSSSRRVPFRRASSLSCIFRRSFWSSGVSIPCFRILRI